MNIRRLVLLAVAVIIALVVIQFVAVAFFGISLGFGLNFLIDPEDTMNDLYAIGLVIVAALVLFFKPLPAMWNWIAGIACIALAAVVWMGWL